MKEIKNISFFKILMIFVMTAVIFIPYFWIVFDVKFPGEVSWLATNILTFVCICACFLYSSLFLKFNMKSFLVTIALGGLVASNYFLLFDNSFVENPQMLSLYILCGVQSVFLFYSLLLCKGNGIRIVNLAVRVAGSLVVCLLLPEYFPEIFTLANAVSIVYMFNFLLTILHLLFFHIKDNWLLVLGLVLLFASEVFSLFSGIWVDIYGISGSFVDFLTNYNLAFYLYIPALFILATSAVFSKKLNNKKNK